MCDASPVDRKSQSPTLRSLLLPNDQLMQADRFTIKSQEALQAAIALAAAARTHRRSQPEHLLAVAARAGRRRRRARAAQARRRRPSAIRARAQRGARRAADARPAPPSPRPRRELLDVLRAAEREMRELKDEYISTEHLLLALAGSSQAGEALRARRRDARTRCCRRSPRSAAPTASPTRAPRTSIQALEKFGRDLTEARRAGQARPGHRPRRRDPPRDPGPLAAARRTTPC